MRPLRILVIGAGLGGLTAASCLRRAGFEVEIFEQAPALGEVGAGIQLGPNAIRVLHQLGIAEALDSVAVRPQTLDVRDWQSGRIINTITLGDAYEQQYGMPYYHVHRADLHALLVDAFEVVAPNAIRLNSQCVGLHEQGGAVTVHFADGYSATGDVVIGADGIHSAVRTPLGQNIRTRSINAL